MKTKLNGYADIIRAYGDPADFGGSVAKSNAWAQQHMDLWSMANLLKSNDKLNVMLAVACPVKHIYCNKDIVENLNQAFTNLLNRGTISELKTFDGCWCIRAKRGSILKPWLKTWSIHSWGLAVDFNAALNPLGGVSAWSPAFIKCFTDAGLVEGWDSGALWTSRKDAMHFQMAVNC